MGSKNAAKMRANDVACIEIFENKISGACFLSFIDSRIVRAACRYTELRTPIPETSGLDFTPQFADRTDPLNE